MDAKTISVAEGSDNAMLGHGPEKRVQTARLLTEKVPGSVVSSGSLRNLIVGLRLDSVDEIGEKDGILDEEYWNVVSNNI